MPTPPPRLPRRRNGLLPSYSFDEVHHEFVVAHTQLTALRAIVHRRQHTGLMPNYADELRRARP